jgi:hypothetical protein
LLDVFEWWGAVAVEEQWCSLWCRMWAASLGSVPGDAHLVDCLVLLAAVVLPAQVLHAVTKLLELLVTRACSDPLVAVLCICYVHIGLVPQCFLLRTDAILD